MARYKVALDNGKALIYAGSMVQSMCRAMTMQERCLSVALILRLEMPTLKTYGVADGVTIGLGGCVYDRVLRQMNLSWGGLDRTQWF